VYGFKGLCVKAIRGGFSGLPQYLNLYDVYPPQAGPSDISFTDSFTSRNSLRGNALIRIFKLFLKNTN
jgi:hypothetical protein